MTIENGLKRILRCYRKHRADWAVLLVGHHEGYLSWADYERNQRLIADNANGKGMMVRGAVRKGEALLVGLLRCGHCGRRLLVSYNGTKGDTGRYHCDATRNNPAAAPCISFGALRVDQAVGAEIVRLLQPLCVDAAVRAITDCEHQAGEKQRQLELALEQTRYETARARRQYDAVDPDNRLVAGELERRWNEKLVQLRDLEVQRESLNQNKQSPALSAEDRARLMVLGKDLSKAWNSPGATIETRKKIIRLLIKEIIVDVADDKLALVIHWQGGDHTEMTVKKNKVGQTRWMVEADVVDLVRVLARQPPDMAIAAILNRSGKLTGHGATWTRTHVRGLRNTNGIPVYREGERAERGEVTLDEAADILKVSRATAYRMVSAGVLPAQQLRTGAPWIIRLADLRDDAVCRDAEARPSRRPISQNPLQNSLVL